MICPTVRLPSSVTVPAEVRRLPKLALSPASDGIPPVQLELEPQLPPPVKAQTRVNIGAGGHDDTEIHVGHAAEVELAAVSDVRAPGQGSPGRNWLERKVSPPFR